MANKEGIFAELSVKGNTTATAISIADTYVQFIGFDTEGESNALTRSSSEDHITSPFNVQCLLTCSITAAAAEATGGDSYSFQIFKNNGSEGYDNLIARRTVSAGAAGKHVMSVSISGVIQVNEDDTIELWVKNEDDNNDILITDCTLTLTRVS